MALRSHANSGLQRTFARRPLLRRAAALAFGVPVLGAWIARPHQVSAEQVAAEAADAVAPPLTGAETGGDPYAWLQDLGDEEVATYLKTENDYTTDAMKPLADLEKSLYEELIARIPEQDQTLPSNWKGYLYYSRFRRDQNFEVYCRRKGTIDAPEEVLLDLNDVGGNNLVLGYLRPSPDNRFLSYTLDETGEGRYTLYVVDTMSGVAGGQEVEKLPSVRDVVWNEDSQTILYLAQDTDNRPFRLMRRTVGSGADPADDELIVSEDDQTFRLSLQTSRDRAFHFLLSRRLNDGEICAIPTGDPAAKCRVIAPRGKGRMGIAEHRDGEFLFLTAPAVVPVDDPHASNYRVHAAPVDDPRQENWRVVAPARADVSITAFDVFARHLVLYVRKEGYSQIEVRDLDTGGVLPIAFPEPPHTVGWTSRISGGVNTDFTATTIRVVRSTFIDPETIYEIDMDTGDRAIVSCKMLGCGLDSTRYRMETLTATAADGEQIPISLVSLIEPPPGMPAGPRPLRLDGYGGYGRVQEPSFVADRLSLIDRGVTYAIAHVRGGGEKGRRWWMKGREMFKEKAFGDFASCAEHLIAHGYTAPDRLVIYGISNGGLLMGVTANQRPDLIRAMVAEAPVADVPALLDTPTGVFHAYEFGAPDNLDLRKIQLRYSPYQNVTVQPYPAMLVTADRNDTVVPLWMPAKWVAKLRDAKRDDTPLLFHWDDAGHFGPTALHPFERRTAMVYAFMLNALGLTAAPPITTSGSPAAPNATGGAPAIPLDSEAIPAR